MEDNLVVPLDSKHKGDQRLDPHFYPKVAELSTKLCILSKREKNMRTNARQNTGKNVKISSKGFAIRTEESNAKQITKGNVIPTGSKSAINCTKMSNKNIKQKNAKIKRYENAKSIGKRVPMAPKIGSIIRLPARPFARPTATPSPSTRPSRSPTKNVTGSLTKPVMTYLTRIVIGSTEKNVRMLPIKTAMMCHGKIVNKSTSPYLIKLPEGDPIECAITRIPMNSPMLKSINLKS